MASYDFLSKAQHVSPLADRRQNSDLSDEFLYWSQDNPSSLSTAFSRLMRCSSSR